MCCMKNDHSHCAYQTTYIGIQPWSMDDIVHNIFISCTHKCIHHLLSRCKGMVNISFFVHQRALLVELMYISAPMEGYAICTSSCMHIIVVQRLLGANGRMPSIMAFI